MHLVSHRAKFGQSGVGPALVVYEDVKDADLLGLTERSRGDTDA